MFFITVQGAIQIEKLLSPVQLLPDMKVQWGSTYIMLH